MTSVNIIGAGKLGQTLGKLWTVQQQADIRGVCNTSIASATKAIAIMGAGKAYATIQALPQAGIILISTPDDIIDEISVELATTLTPGTVVMHCSGSLSSEALDAVKTAGAFVAGVHPMKSFTHETVNVKGTYCAMEGDEQALALIEPLFKAIGSITYRIDKKHKALYHAAGVFASNYVVTLAQHAVDCLLNAGINQNMAHDMVLSLMQGTLDNMQHVSAPQQALTGPIQRGDVATLTAHLAALTDPAQQRLYQQCGLATLALTHPTHETKTMLEKHLNQHQPHG